MDIIIKKLTKELAEDYVHFFAPVKHFVFSLSGTKKRQLPRTLYDIVPKLVEVFENKNRHLNYKMLK